MYGIFNQHQWSMRALTIHLSDGDTIRDFIEKEVRSRVSKRYKLSHIAEDMGITYIKLWRFLNGAPVNEDFYIKFFKYYER